MLVGRKGETWKYARTFRQRNFTVCTAGKTPGTYSGMTLGGNALSAAGVTDFLERSD